MSTSDAIKTLSSQPPSGPAGGDLSGSYPNPQVVGLQTKQLDASLITIGAAQDGYALTWHNASSSWQALPEGSSVTLVGDVTGPSGSNTVININGASVPVSGSLTTGNVLQVSGSSALSYAAVNLGGGANYVTGTLPAGNQAAQNMGGDVGGTTAASTITSLAVSKLAAGTSAQVLLNSGTPTPTWTTLSQDAITSSTGAITVQGIQTKSLNSSLSTIGAAQDGYVLTWNNGGGYWQANAIGFNYDFLLDCEPPEPNNNYANVYNAVTQQITNETWKRPDTTLIKSIDYTYSGILMTQEVRKIFATDGITIVAELTIVYTYTSPLVVSAVYTRNI